VKADTGLKRIWFTFTGFIVLFVLNLVLDTNIGPTSMMWLLFDACILIFSIIMLVKNKLPTSTQLLISLTFGLLMFVAYQGISFSSVSTFLITLLASLASFSIFNNYNKNAVRFIKSTAWKSVFVSIGLGFLVGTVLGVINFFLNSEAPDFNISLSSFLTALSPAVYEEIAMRTFIYAVCLYFLKGEIHTKGERLACYFMMIIPHAMIHTPQQFVSYGLVSGIISILILALLFGLPLALLQKKRDVTSAMIAHGVVDVIRFCFFGLPY
jgi:hypothetical protein